MIVSLVEIGLEKFIRNGLFNWYDCV